MGYVIPYYANQKAQKYVQALTIAELLFRKLEKEKLFIIFLLGIDIGCLSMTSHLAEEV